MSEIQPVLLLRTVYTLRLEQPQAHASMSRSAAGGPDREDPSATRHLPHRKFHANRASLAHGKVG